MGLVKEVYQHGAVHRLGLAAELLTVAGLAGTVLAALGAVFAFVIVAADGRPLRFFAHLQNLATHYLFADPAARKHFDGQVLVLFLGVVGLFLIARLPGFATRLRRELACGGRHG